MSKLLWYGLLVLSLNGSFLAMSVQAQEPSAASEAVSTPAEDQPEPRRRTPPVLQAFVALLATVLVLLVVCIPNPKPRSKVRVRPARRRTH